MTRATGMGQAFRRIAMATGCLAGIWFCAPWPVAQGCFSGFLVVGLVPGFQDRLTGALWAAAAGWVLEATLRTYAHAGGTALGNMLTGLVATWLLQYWPPELLHRHWFRCALLVLLQTLLVHGCVRVAVGSHPWGMGWVGALLGVPLWATLVFRLHRSARSR